MCQAILHATKHQKVGLEPYIMTQKEPNTDISTKKMRMTTMGLLIVSLVCLLFHASSNPSKIVHGGVNYVDRRGGGGGGHGGHGGGGHAHGGGGGLGPLVIPVYAGGAHRTTRTHNGGNSSSCNCPAHSQLASTIFALFLLLCF
ncbi:hypothetical protein LXL04_004703 [Taraxacum kok-saghyz]